MCSTFCYLIDIQRNHGASSPVQLHPSSDSADNDDDHLCDASDNRIQEIQEAGARAEHHWSKNDRADYKI